MSKTPKIEMRNTERGLRWYVKDVPEFGGSQKYGFKSEEKLWACWKYWYARTKGGTIGFRDGSPVTPRPACKPKPSDPVVSHFAKVMLEHDADDIDVPSWLD